MWVELREHHLKLNGTHVVRLAQITKTKLLTKMLVRKLTEYK